MNEMSAKGSGDGTVGKALDVLDMVAAHGRPTRFAELLAISPLPKATLYRLLQTLSNQGMLHFDADRGTYEPGLRLVRLAHTAWARASLAPIARAHLDALSARVGETIHLAQLDRAQVLYVDKRNAHQPLEMFSEAGKVGPSYCTGVGKAMLAHLPDEERAAALQMQAFFPHTAHTLTSVDALEDELAQVRADGIAFDREEHEPGIICIAAPIVSHTGRALGALSITTSTREKSLADLAALRPDLIRTAHNIAEAARDWRFPD